MLSTAFVSFAFNCGAHGLTMNKPIASVDQPKLDGLSLTHQATLPEIAPILPFQRPPPQLATIPDQFADLMEFSTVAQLRSYGIKELRSPLSD